MLVRGVGDGGVLVEAWCGSVVCVLACCPRM